MQLLSHPGEKRLDAASLKEVVALPTLSEADTQLLKSLISEVISQADRLERVESITRRHEAVISDIRRNLLSAQFGPVTSLNLSAAIADISTTLPPQVRLIAKRHDSVTSLLNQISLCDWLAVYGSIGCGKTQLAALLGDQLDSIVYVSLRDLTSDEANFLLHHVFVQFCHNNRTGTVTDSGLTALAHGTVIFLDDVPRLIAGDQLSQRLVRIAETVRTRNQTLVTLSHHPISADVLSLLQHARSSEILAPRFNRDDILDLLKQYGAPANVTTSHIADHLLYTTSGNPTLLCAVVRHAQASNWHNIHDSALDKAEFAPLDQLVRETMFRLLTTVEDERPRELLYRLCVISGLFGTQEVDLVARVPPRLAKARESYTNLQGLWIEQQADDLSLVCPLIAHFGAHELGEEVEHAVADALAAAILQERAISPIDFAKALNYLRRAKNGVALGMHLLKGLESIDDLPTAWKRLVFLASVSDGVLDDCPLVLAILIRAKQIVLAHALNRSFAELVSDANDLITKASPQERWAVLAFAAQVAPIVATDDLDEGLKLCAYVLDNFSAVVEYLNFRRFQGGQVARCRQFSRASSN